MKTKQNNKNGVHRPSQSWLVIPLAIIAMLLGLVGSKAQTSPNGDWTDGFDNNTSGAQDSTAGWAYFYNGAGTVGLDTTVKETGAGSLAITIPFLPDGSVDQGTWFGNFDNISAFDSDIVYDGTQFTNIEFDILMDPSDPLSTNGDYGIFGVGLEEKATPAGANQNGTVTIPASASNTWFHASVPLDKSTVYFSNPGVIGVAFTYSTYANAVTTNNGGPNNTFLTNTVIMHIDNLRVQLGATTNPPPIMSIGGVTPGLNFVQGSISSQFDRQNIATASGNNYAWADTATAGNPATYSFNISQFNAPDLNYHIYFYQTAGAGGASAPDYNQPNVMIFQVSPLTNTTPVSAVASITWKTNSPSSGTSVTAIQVTNSTLLGNWQLQFTSATAGTIIAPGAVSYPFTLDPSVSSSLADPITVNFGLNPSIDSNYIVGEKVVVSQIAITGSGALSVNYPTTDNFLADSILDTNTWTVNALYPASILFVPSNAVYTVGWTLPAPGYSLEQNAGLSGANAWTVPPSVSTAVLPPGVVAIIPKSTLPAGNNGFYRLAKLTATQLQVLLPGETNAPGTPSGKIGTPIAQSVSTPTTVTVNACDANWNIVSISDSIQLSSMTDGSAFIPNQASLVNGTVTFSGANGLLFQTQGTQTVTATDEAVGTTILAGTSSPVTVGP